MPDVKISELPAASSVAGTDQLAGNQSGTTRRATLAQIKALFEKTPILGEVSGDTLTINAGTWTIGNNYVATRAGGTVAAGVVNLQDWEQTATGDAGGTTDLRGWISQVSGAGGNAFANIRNLIIATHNGTAAATQLQGLNSVALISNSGNAINAQAFRGVVQVTSSGGSTAGDSFLAAAPTLTSTGVITTLTGFNSANLGHATLVTNAIGHNAQDMTAAATLTAGFRGQVTSGTGKWNLYMSGTAANHLAGVTYIGDTANANNTAGLTINQGGASNHILTLKSSDVAHALVSGGDFAVETDDFFAVKKSANNLQGGVSMMAIAEDDSAVSSLKITAYGGTASTDDTTTSAGLVNIVVAEHDGANATIAAPANQNIFTIRAATGAATYATRLLLKGDDGELHLGNTTLVALDDEDDALLTRAMQRVSSASGIILTEYDNPFDSHEWLASKGLAGQKDENGSFLFPLQSRLHVHEGAIWQGYVRQRQMEKRIADLEEILKCRKS